MYVVISSCTARKDDSIAIPDNSRLVEPNHYLEEPLLSRLLKTRDRILSDPRTRIGKRTTYAFDLYVRAGKAYKDVFKNYYYELKSLLISGKNVDWFFLSGGYGIIHALESARAYQATFSRTIAHQKNIPYTGDLWRTVLPQIIDAILSKLSYDCVYVFGSRDYTDFVKETKLWRNAGSSGTPVKIFESSGSAGPIWLSPILCELVGAILNGEIESFNSRYGGLTRQRS